MGGVSAGKISAGVAQRLGVVGAHAYSVVGAHEYHGEKHLQMRNPWGERLQDPADNKELLHQPSGRRGSWTALFGAKQDKDNGVFVLPFAEVVEHFSSVMLSWDPGMFTFHQATLPCCPCATVPLSRAYRADVSLSDTAPPL